MTLGLHRNVCIRIFLHTTFTVVDLVDALGELKQRENYMEKTLQHLNKLIEEDGSRITANIAKLKTILNIWLEMPFGKYISKDRYVNQQNFEFYEEQYNHHYSLL